MTSKNTCHDHKEVGCVPDSATLNFPTPRCIPSGAMVSTKILPRSQMVECKSDVDECLIECTVCTIYRAFLAQEFSC